MELRYSIVKQVMKQDIEGFQDDGVDWREEVDCRKGMGGKVLEVYNEVLNN